MKGTVAMGVVVLVALTIACQQSSVAPSGGSTSNGSSAASVVAIAINGPTQLAPGETARFTAIATMSDGSTQDYTLKVAWNAAPAEVLTIARSTGEATANGSGDATVFADGTTACCVRGRAAVLVVPANTFRLTGQVRESGLPVQGAKVSVISGIGSGQSTTTDYSGQYRLYGVAGPLLIRLTQPGYVDLEKPFVASQNDVLDFLEARQTQAIPSIAGAYVLTVQADAGCPTVSTDPRSIPLPAEMQQARSYPVQLTQDGPALNLVGTAPTFLPPSDRVEGRITPDGVEFQFGNGYIGYGPDDGLSAHISPTQVLSYEGQVYATPAGRMMTGRLDGEIQLLERSTTYRGIGQCVAGNHRVSLSAAPATASR